VTRSSGCDSIFLYLSKDSSEAIAVDNSIENTVLFNISKGVTFEQIGGMDGSYNIVVIFM
jgi:hypothetical protein